MTEYKARCFAGWSHVDFAGNCEYIYGQKKVLSINSSGKMINNLKKIIRDCVEKDLLGPMPAKLMKGILFVVFVLFSIDNLTAQQKHIFSFGKDDFLLDGKPFQIIIGEMH